MPDQEPLLTLQGIKATRGGIRYLTSHKVKQ